MHKEMTWIYTCEFCGAEFRNVYECQKHEAEHVPSFDKWENEELADALRALPKRSYNYQGETVVRFPEDGFTHLVETVADRLSRNEHKVFITDEDDNVRVTL